MGGGRCGRWEVCGVSVHGLLILSFQVSGLELSPVVSAAGLAIVVHGTYHRAWGQIRQQVGDSICVCVGMCVWGMGVLVCVYGVWVCVGMGYGCVLVWGMADLSTYRRS